MLQAGSSRHGNISGVAQWSACWAHNPKVPGSKPGSAKLHAEHGLVLCGLLVNIMQLLWPGSKAAVFMAAAHI